MAADTRQQQQHELSHAPDTAALSPACASAVEIFQKTISGELTAATSVTERTTRGLK